DVGGLVGTSTSDIVDCAAFGQVNQQSASGQRVGGLIGQQTGHAVQRSSAVGQVVSSGAVVGGLIGQSSNVDLQDSYATGTVQGTNTVGGMLGSASSGTVARTYCRGVVTAS